MSTDPNVFAFYFEVHRMNSIQLSVLHVYDREWKEQSRDWRMELPNEIWPVVLHEEKGDEIKRLEMTMNCGC